MNPIISVIIARFEPNDIHGWRMAEAALRLKRPITGLSPRAADQLLRYDWPGNVRELENVMERAVALARVTRTELEDLPEEVRQAIAIPTDSGGVKALDEVEKEYIMSVLDRNGGNQTHTAEQLGIGSATLYRKLKKYGVVRGGGRTRRCRRKPAGRTKILILSSGVRGNRPFDPALPRYR